MIAPKIEEMAAEFPDVMFLKVDVDECEDIAAEYNITSMPTFLYIKNKKQVGEAYDYGCFLPRQLTRPCAYAQFIYN